VILNVGNIRKSRGQNVMLCIHVTLSPIGSKGLEGLFHRISHFF
jgi:hypothetical protein